MASNNNSNRESRKVQARPKQYLLALACASFLLCWVVYGRLLNKRVQPSFGAVFVNGSKVTLHGQVEQDVLDSLADNQQFMDLLDSRMKEEEVHRKEEEYDQDVHELMGNPVQPGKGVGTRTNTAASNPPRLGSQASLNTSATLASYRSSTRGFNPIASSSGKSSGSRCSHSDKVKALICSVSLEPAGVWLQPFRSEQLRMSVSYPFETLSIRLEVRACSCGKSVHIGAQDGAATSSTLVVKAGETTVALFVTDDSHSKQWVYNKYYLTLLRNTSLPSPKEPFAPQTKYAVCRLYQDCDMQLRESLPCGLTPEQGPAVSWKQYMQKQHEKSLCDNAHHEGYWSVPCKSCDNRESCYWNESKWITDKCRYGTIGDGIDIAELRRKLEGKTVLFFGDSTLRGMMFYMIEKINGTLQEWSVIHDYKIFNCVNFGKTKIIFMYYPQFFLPSGGPRNNLSSLLRDFGKFKNSTETVLVFGGVQWMGVKFLDNVMLELRQSGLSGIKLIVKGYGAGFHIPEAGILFRTLEEQKMVAERNAQLIRRSLELGFGFVDTFWMTTSRHKQHLHGICACHFHTIVPLSNSYRIAGPINAAYSNILLQLLTK